ncbi:MAG: potassium transporter TrkG [Desulfobulbus sp.]|jgi:trk system potassium uptake protein TrkH
MPLLFGTKETSTPDNPIHPAAPDTGIFPAHGTGKNAFCRRAPLQGGGVKTTTLALLACILFSRIRHRKRVNMFKKSIPERTVQRTTALITLSTFIIGLVVFMLLLSDSFIEPESAQTRTNALQYLFETVSAFATVGLSMGITPFLTTWDKSWIILMMLVGRVGVLTFSYIIIGPGTLRGREYSEENMMIG